MKLRIDSRGDVWITKLGQECAQWCPIREANRCGMPCPLCLVRTSGRPYNGVVLELCSADYVFDVADVTIEEPFKLQGD